MSINAVYAVNEYIKATLLAEGLNCGEFYPGRYAPSIENAVKFVTYSVVPSDTYDLAGLKRDFISYRFYNSDFDELHRVVGVVRRSLNVYDIEQTSLSEPDIIFQETFFRVTSDGEASFAEGIDYFFLGCELTLQYTESIYSSDTTNVFIQGV